jgi:transglutaminase-like putative cysteine protease
MGSASFRSSNHFRPIITIAVVGLWAVLMGVLVKDQYLPGATSVNDVFQIAQAESDNWFVIRIRGAYAGFGRSRQFRSGSGWTVKDDLNVSLNLQGQIKPIRIENESKVDEQFRMVSFRMKVSSGIMSFEQKGHMEGRELVLELPKSQGGGSKRLKLYESPRMSRSLGLPVPLTGLKVGDDFRIPVFDPHDGQKWDAVVKVLEKADLDVARTKVEAWRVRATFRTVELYMWIDDEGRLLKGAMPLGITVIRSDKQEVARELRTAGNLPDFPELASVPLEGSSPDVETPSSWRLKVISSAGIPVPSDDFRQKLTGDELTVSREKLPAETYTLPCKDPERGPELQPSRFIQSDNAAIIKAARKVVGDEKDPIKAARLINHWVYTYLRKVPTPVVPDAYSVLTTKQGACNEHAVLAASLARAVGLPSRIAVGLVYSEGSFYYHAWVQYWAGARWFTGDPLMDQLPVDLGHIALIYGDVDKHMNVLAFLGQIHLKLLEAKM